MPMIKVNVTQEDIDTTDDFSNVSDCAMAKALRRAIPEFNYLTLDYFYIGRGLDEPQQRLPKEAAEWNRKVNNAGADYRSTFKPIAFEVEIP